jgi:hypothetical protein
MYVLWPVVRIPLLLRNEAAVFIAGRTGRWIECGAIFCVGGETLGHLVVDFQDAELGAVSAIIPEVFAFDDGEGFHDVFYSMAGSGEIRK